VGRGDPESGVNYLAGDRRGNRRYGLRLEGHWKLMRRHRVLYEGASQTLDLSSAGEARAVVLAAAGRKWTDAAAVRGHGTADCRPAGGDGVGGSCRQKTDRGGTRGGSVRTQATEKMRLADFEILEQDEAHVWRGASTAGGKKSQTCRSKSKEWRYTQLYREAQNGNPGLFRWVVEWSRTAHECP
jgi:hypothetical protein